MRYTKEYNEFYRLFYFIFKLAGDGILIHSFGVLNLSV